MKNNSKLQVEMQEHVDKFPEATVRECQKAFNIACGLLYRRKGDAELNAINACHEILSGLSKKERKRALASLARVYEKEASV